MKIVFFFPVFFFLSFFFFFILFPISLEAFSNFLHFFLSFSNWFLCSSQTFDCNTLRISNIDVELVRKVSTRLYFPRQLKKSCVATRELFLFYITCICSILEYGSPVFHRGLPVRRLETSPRQLASRYSINCL